MTDFRAMLDRHGISQSECARRFGIPLRTVQRWATGESTCPDYTLRMIDELLTIKTWVNKKSGD